MPLSLLPTRNLKRPSDQQRPPCSSDWTPLGSPLFLHPDVFWSRLCRPMCGNSGSNPSHIVGVCRDMSVTSAARPLKGRSGPYESVLH